MSIGHDLNTGGEIDVGESVSSAEIPATDEDADTGIDIIAGRTYCITPEIVEPLQDKKIPVATTDGFKTEEAPSVLSRFFLRLGQRKRRVRESNWFYLFGYIGAETGDTLVPIGSGTTFTAAHTGRLFVFVNDHPDYYHNNQGSYRIHVTRNE